MRKIALINLAVILLAVAFSTACISKKKYQELEAAKAQSEEALRKEISDRESQISELKSKSDKLQQDLNMSEQEITKFAGQVKEQNAKISSLHKSIAEAFEIYNAGDISVEERDGKLYVTMDNAILFEAGRAKLTDSSKQVVATFADVLKRNPDLDIHVEGHTDNDPVKIHKNRYENNWALSTARSLAIVAELEKMGVDGKRLTASGKGEVAPKAPNDTKENKMLNRRTEFIVVPKIDGLYRLYKENMGSSK